MRKRGGSDLGVRGVAEEKVFLHPLSVPGWDSREKSTYTFYSNFTCPWEPSQENEKPKK